MNCSKPRPANFVTVPTKIAAQLPPTFPKIRMAEFIWDPLKLRKRSKSMFIRQRRCNRFLIRKRSRSQAKKRRKKLYCYPTGYLATFNKKRNFTHELKTFSLRPNGQKRLYQRLKPLSYTKISAIDDDVDIGNRPSTMYYSLSDLGEKNFELWYLANCLKSVQPIKFR